MQRGREDRMKLTLPQIAAFVHGSGEFSRNIVATGYSIDSRTIRPGELFFAVKGEKMDGHDFVAQALEKGAAAAIVSAKLDSFSGPKNLIKVQDTLLALQELGSSVRRIWGKPLIGVTGSAGKTTTKEAIAHVLASKFRVHKSEGNFNNHFGLPLMLLKLQPEHDLAVVELGMSHAGEIAALAKIAQPETGVVTNVAPVHLEFFNSVAEIAAAKRELIQSLPVDGTAVLNSDDEYVSQFGRGFSGKVVTYGFGEQAVIRGENFEPRGENGSSLDIVLDDNRAGVNLPLVGKHNAYNALAATAVALQHRMSLMEIAAALARLSPAEKRGEVVRIGNITFINDCYNSNPKALAAMVDALATMPARRRIVIAGEMLELGPQATSMHAEAGRHMAKQGIDIVLGVRGLAEHLATAAKESGTSAMFLSTPEEAGQWLAREARDGDVVLLKASRGVKLEKAFETWRNHLSGTAGGC
jgi:UDP-N-acetylmuramoyl-tripeptide--D-alanyl-D-alanine ligase